jgi:hypothetical protein
MVQISRSASPLDGNPTTLWRLKKARYQRAYTQLATGQAENELIYLLRILVTYK